MSYCTACGYNLANNTLPARCPECGQVVTQIAVEPPGPAWHASAALALVLALPLVLLLGGREPALNLLIAALACGVALAAAVWRQRRRGPRTSIAGPVLSAASLLFPLLTLALFLWVFVFGGSSNVAQLAGGSGADLRDLWISFWPILLLGNPASALIAIAAVAVQWYRPQQFASFALPAAAIIADCAAASIALKYFPDA